jgi:two-component system chemotaxis response regulator CheB
VEEGKHIIAIGASAGGLKVITEILSGLPAELDAAIFVTVHISKNSMADIIRQMFQKRSNLQCVIPQDGDKIKKGHVYIAPPDRHLFIEKGKILVTHGPHENRWRPSIDVLFRSAAAAYDSRVIGIILSGLMDDGTSGMGAIKRSGGITIVQEPAEAEFDDMPTNVINNVEVDYRVPSSDIPYVVRDILSKPLGAPKEIPREIKIEAEITARMSGTIDTLKEIGDQSPFICPDCGGGLFEIRNDNIYRYRCHTGHVYTEKLLLEKQSEELEESLWVAIRMMEERRNLLITVAAHDRQAGNEDLSKEKLQKADELKAHIDRMKSLLVSVNAYGERDKA